MRCWIAAVLVLAVLWSVSSAATRTWTSSSGKYSVEAEMVGSKDGKVQLRKADGNTVAIPLSKLSEADQRYVAEQAGKSEQPSGGKPDAAGDDAAPKKGENTRTWTSKGGNYTLEAELLSFEKGDVELRKPDGEVITVPLKKLCLEDYRYVRRHVASTRESTGSSSDEGGSGARRPSAPSVALSNDGPTALEMERHLLEVPSDSSKARPNPVTEYLVGMTTPQTFYARSGKDGASSASDSFGQVVSKEPKYQSREPFRGVARLGSHQYAFVLDAAGAGASGYGRLYFDLNHNGDLTDEKPVDAVDGSNNSTASYAYTRYQFPRLEVKVDADGTEIDYAFLLGVYTRTSAESSYTSASLYAAAFREGYVGRGKDRTCIVLVDSNSNGRFDDKCSVSNSGSGGRVLPAYGDVLLVNPNPSQSGESQRLHLSKLVSIGDRFYELEVAPSGDKVTFSPSSAPVGYVTNSSPGYSAVVYNDEYGVVKIAGSQSKRVPLPAGQWKLASYSIGVGNSQVSASALSDFEAVTVKKGETAPMPFGGPYKPVVTCSGGTGKASLSLSIVGVGGEQCTSLLVNGRRPPGPQFVILSVPDGKVVEQGKFEYG